MKKSYEIRIQETTTETKVVKGSWGKVIDDSDAGYGYADDQEREVENTNTVYEQTVDGLDIAWLVKMINTPGIHLDTGTTTEEMARRMNAVGSPANIG